MRYGIFADVHSNLEALTAVLEELQGQGVDRLLCAGDLVGYGADPSACLDRLRQAGVVAVAGNHDWAAAGKMPLEWFNEAASAAVEWTARQLGQEDQAYLRGLALVWKDPNVTLAHASLENPERFCYLFDSADAEPSLRLLSTPAGFIGHTHVPALFRSGDRMLVNVGSVGQPRDGDPRAAYCLYDSDNRQAQIRRVPYPVEKTQQKILKAGLPPFLARRLLVGS